MIGRARSEADRVAAATAKLLALARHQRITVHVVALAEGLNGTYLPHPPPDWHCEVLAAWVSAWWEAGRPAMPWAQRLPRGRPAILLSDRLDPEQALRTLAHELGHHWTWRMAPGTTEQDRERREVLADAWRDAWLRDAFP